MVLVTILPEFRLPKSMSVHMVVACGSLKTPTLTVLVVMPLPRCPWAGTFCWAMSTPAVTAERAIAVKTRAISGIRAALFSCMYFPKLMAYSVLINATSFQSVKTIAQDKKTWEQTKIVNYPKIRKTCETNKENQESNIQHHIYTRDQ
jgi:hypothetical protein